MAMQAEALAMDELIAQQRHREAKRWRMLGLLLLLCGITLLADVITGPSMLSLSQVWAGLSGNADATTLTIVRELRLPTALMALVVGAALGVGGAEIQTLLNNPMASPYTLGLAAAAGFGASLVIAFGSFGLPVALAVPIGAFIMTMLAAGVLFIFATLPRMSSTMLVLAGIALLFLFQSLLSLVQYLSAPEIGQQIVFWLFGSLAKANWTNLGVVTAVSVVCIALLFKDAWQLTALKLGEARAASLGVNTKRLRLRVIVLVAVMTATAISFVGIIGFIGLVAPQIARMVVGEDQRFYLPASLLCGAVFLSAASVLSKALIPGALFPVGIVCSFVGIPFFFWVMVRR
jgi:iron complex transport system permease protein